MPLEKRLEGLEIGKEKEDRTVVNMCRFGDLPCGKGK